MIKTIRQVLAVLIWASMIILVILGRASFENWQTILILFVGLIGFQLSLWELNSE